MANKEENMLKFTEEMKERIETIQEPVIKNREELQRVQLASSASVTQGLMYAIISAMAKMGAIDRYYYDKDEAEDCLSEEFWDKLHPLIDDDLNEATSVMISAARSTAINYAGLVLNGVMKPIYDDSLAKDEDRAISRKNIEHICQVVGMSMGEQGLLEETKFGTMELNGKLAIFKSKEEVDEQKRTK